MKRIIILLVACLTSGMMLANHWTPVPEGWYSQSTTIRGVILINGVEQYSDQLELGIFCGDECRGSAIAAEFFITHRFIADVNVYGENGHQLSFRLYDHSQGKELELTPPEGVVFTEDGYGQWLDPCVFNFTSSSSEITNHWTPIPEGWYSQSTTIRGVILIDGVEQYSDQLELGIFCGDECRGSAIAAEFFITHRYIADVNVYGENGHQLSFRLYDHSQGKELELTPPESVVFTEDGYGEWLEPCEFNFVSVATTQTSLLAQGWNWWAPTVSTSIEAVEDAIGNAFVSIQSKQGPVSGEATAGAMYRILTNAACTFSLSGMPMSSVTVDIEPGVNWFGFMGAQPTVISDAISITASVGDKIISQNEGFAIFTSDGWQGTLSQLKPGYGYLYTSSENKTLIIETGD